MTATSSDVIVTDEMGGAKFHGLLQGARPWLAVSGETPDPLVLAECRGVGLLRSEYVIRDCGYSVEHPAGARAVADYLRSIISAAAGLPVWYRFADLEARDVAQLAGSTAAEVFDDNPIMGCRGVRRSHHFPDEFAAELESIAPVVADHPNVGLLVPYVRDASEFRAVRDKVWEAGITAKIGAMVEVPSAVHSVRDILAAGAACLAVGMNDLTALTLGAGRGSSEFDYSHPAVYASVQSVVLAAHEAGVEVLVAGKCSGQDNPPPEFCAPRRVGRALPGLGTAGAARVGRLPRQRPGT
jgi:phosphoenolpyruvate-protein kinase (PTS system EI component)